LEFSKFKTINWQGTSFGNIPRDDYNYLVLGISSGFLVVKPEEWKGIEVSFFLLLTSKHTFSKKKNFLTRSLFSLAHFFSLKNFVFQKNILFKKIFLTTREQNYLLRVVFLVIITNFSNLGL